MRDDAQSGGTPVLGAEWASAGHEFGEDLDRTVKGDTERPTANYWSGVAKTGEGRGQAVHPHDPRQVDRREGLDSRLLGRAREILEGIDLESPEEIVLCLPAMRGIAVELWRSAIKASREHQDLLALVENALISWDCLDEKRAKSLLGCFRDLSAPLVTEAHLDVARSLLVRCGWNPLGFLGEGADGEGE